jgi:hypothetical protein
LAKIGAGLCLCNEDSLTVIKGEAIHRHTGR